MAEGFEHLAVMAAEVTDLLAAVPTGLAVDATVGGGGHARALLTAGTVVGAPTLLRFYVLHCIFIPIIASILMILHFWRIRKDGGISGPL